MRGFQLARRHPSLGEQERQVVPSRLPKVPVTQVPASPRSYNRENLRRAGFGEAENLRQLRPPFLHDAVKHLLILMLVIEAGVFLVGHLHQGIQPNAPAFGLLGANQFRNQLIGQLGLSPLSILGGIDPAAFAKYPGLAMCPGMEHPSPLCRLLIPYTHPFAPWRSYEFVSYIFLHGGLIHVGLNMLAFMAVGPTMLRRMGYFRFLAFFLFAGIAGGLAQIGITMWVDNLPRFFGLTPFLAQPRAAPLVGASGAIMALWLGCLRMQWDRLRRMKPANRPIEPAGYLLRVFLYVILLNIIFIVINSVISGEAHLGGAAFGFVFAPIFYRTTSSVRRQFR